MEEKEKKLKEKAFNDKEEILDCTKEIEEYISKILPEEN